MLLQKAGDEGGTVPPSGFIPPAWDVLARRKEWSADLASTPPPTVAIGPADVPLGHDDVEAEDSGSSSVAGLVGGNEYELGWDNESPSRIAKLGGTARVETRPVLNAEYHAFWRKEQDGTSPSSKLPASWIVNANGDLEVRMVFSDPSTPFDVR